MSDSSPDAVRPRVLVTYPLPEDALQPLVDVAEVVVLDDSTSLADAVADNRDAVGIVCLLTDTIDEALLGRLPHLRWVSSISVGVDHIDVERLTAKHIAVGNTPGVLVDATADIAFALLLAAARRVSESDRFVRDGQWQPGGSWNPAFFLGKQVSGATLGIVGLGAIGQAVARRAQGFGMRVIGWAPSGREVTGVASATLDEVLSESDFVSVHVALTDTTRHLLGAAELATMKAGSVLVNTARGGIVDETALYDALQRGHLFAAGLDVFAEEPLPQNHPLLQLDSVVITPHIGSATADTRQAMVRIAIANAVAGVKGEPMPHCVNPDSYNS